MEKLEKIAEIRFNYGVCPNEVLETLENKGFLVVENDKTEIWETSAKDYILLKDRWNKDFIGK